MSINFSGQNKQIVFFTIIFSLAFSLIYCILTLNGELNILNFWGKSDRFVQKNLPSKYLADEQIPQSELLYTTKWDLFNLYKFQKLNPKERIKEFENNLTMYTVSDLIKGFVDKNQTYKIANNYCIKHNGQNDLEKVTCTNNTIDIKELPYEKCEWFSGQDDKGQYYIKYNLDELWQEFNQKGISKVEQEIEQEENKFSLNQNMQSANVPDNKLFNIFENISKLEKNLEQAFNEGHEKEENNKIFEKFLANLDENTENILNNISYDKSFNDYGIKLSAEVSDAMTRPANILNPKVNTLQIYVQGGLTIKTNYQYFLNNYSPYLTKDWEEYFQKRIEEDKDFTQAHYNDDGISYINACKKWVNKWDNFVQDNPDFILNSKIKTDIKNYQETLNNLVD